MIDGVTIIKIQKFEDERGWLAEIYREDQTDYRPVMSYVSMTKPGAVRGPHEHTRQADCFVFLGPGSFEIHLWDGRTDSPTKGEYLMLEAGENSPSLVIVPPGVIHGYKCVSETPGFTINLPDKLYKGENKSEEVDEIRHEQDPVSPYIIK